MWDDLSAARVYAPALTVVIMSVLQTVVVIAQMRIDGARRRRRGEPVVDIPLDESVWDDVACSVACSSVLCGLCYLGATDWAWLVVAPVILLGAASTTYHFFQIGIDSAPRIK
jgi:hypothetical protein